MNNTDSLFLNNTRKDLIGGTTAVVLPAIFLEVAPTDDRIDAEVKALLKKNAPAIDKFVDAVLSTALAKDIAEEVSGVVGDLVAGQPGYYNRLTINSLLSLYADEKQMKDFLMGGAAEFHVACEEVMRKKLLYLVTLALWCRVDAYDRGAVVSSFNLSEIGMASLALIPERYRDGFGSCEEWIVKAKNHWRLSPEVRRGLMLTDGLDSGLTKVLAQI